MPGTTVRAHRPFALVLGGGGARGFAHLGILRALEHYGYRPCLIVGVSMGAARRSDGRHVVVKVRRPDLRAVIDRDTAVLEFEIATNSPV